jgi:hypothetical protein
MIRYAGCFGIMMDFFKQPRASVQIKAGGSLNFFEVIWSLSADSVYFLPLHYFDLKSDWLPLITFLFGSPPEDLLFRYLLFVPIRYHGFFNFSRRNVSQIQTSAFVRNTDFIQEIPFSHWLGCADMVWWSCWVGFPALFYFPPPQAADPAGGRFEPLSKNHCQKLYTPLIAISPGLC